MEKSMEKPLYRQIVDFIKQRIEDKELLPGDKLPTEVDLAKSFNVSRITSKKALDELKKMKFISRMQGSGSYVSYKHESIDKVEVVNSGGYKNLKSIAIVLPFDASIGRIIDYIKGVSEGIEKNGYYVKICCTDRDSNKERMILYNLYKEKVDGIIYYPINDNKNLDVVQMLYVYNYPIIIIDKYFEGIPISNVVSDNFKGSYETTNYLISLGHKNIAYISDIDIGSATSVRDRFFGYVQALKDNNLQMNNEIIKLNFNEVGNRVIQKNSEIDYAKFSEMLKDTIRELLIQKVTAIITVNDYVAINIIETCKGLNIDIPEQISIIGFDNLELTQFISIPLTTVEQNFYEIGKVSAHMIMDEIENGRGPYVQKLIPTTFIQRYSCSQI
jgi:GntR family transcriptional regulator, arabinose operon transcriptional repressor